MNKKFENMKSKLQGLVKKLAPVKATLLKIKDKLPKKKPHSEKYYKRIAFFNKYSLIFHFILACFLTFVIEIISRRDVLSALSFVHNLLLFS